MDPADVYAVVTRRMSGETRVHVVEGDGQGDPPRYDVYRDTLSTTDTLDARNPERVLLQIDKERARGEMEAENDAAAHALFLTLDAVSEVAAGAESPGERAADAAEGTKYQLYRAEERAENRHTQARLRQHRARWAQEALRRTTLVPGPRTTDFVVVPVDPKAGRLVLHMDLGSRVVTVPSDRRATSHNAESPFATHTTRAAPDRTVARWGRRISLILLVAWGLLLATRCHLPRQTVRPTADSTSAVYLVRHGWHAGIAVRRADVPDDRWPVLEDFANARYLEVGWGEVRYYPGETRGAWGMTRAGLWPTGSVLHVVPIDRAVPERFPEQTVVRVPVSPSEFDALTTFVAESFVVDSTGEATVAAPGYYVNSRFYRSPLTYHVFNNCNHWAAAALEAAGCDVSPRWAFTVGQVVRQARDCGTLLEREMEE